MKKLMGLSLALGLMLGLGGVVRQAEAINPDAMTIRLAPLVSLNVAITTTTSLWRELAGPTDINPSQASGAMDLGSLSLGNTVYMLQPAAVTVTTEFADTELDVKVVGLGSGAEGIGAWIFDTDGTAAQDQMQVYALFSDTGTATAPALTDFTDCPGPCTNAEIAADQIATTDRRYGRNAADDTTNDSIFQEATYNSASENINDASTDKRHLWIRVDLPPTTSDSGEKKFSIVLTAVAAD